MTGYVDEPMRPGDDPWKQDRVYRKVVDGLRIHYESQGNLAVQTVVLLTSVEQLMEKTNVLLEQLNATMSDVLGRLTNASVVGDAGSTEAPVAEVGADEGADAAPQSERDRIRGEKIAKAMEDISVVDWSEE